MAGGFVSRPVYLAYLDLTSRRSLEETGARSLVSPGNGKVARALDKTQDSQEVIRLVEKLGQQSSTTRSAPEIFRF